MDVFWKVVEQFGLPWALVVVLGIAYWQQNQFINTKTVPRDIYEKQVCESFKEINETNEAIISTQNELLKGQEKVLFILSMSSGGKGLLGGESLGK